MQNSRIQIDIFIRINYNDKKEFKEGVDMYKKIKKIVISACKAGFIMGQQGEIIEQSITIKCNGQIRWRGIRTLTQDEIEQGFAVDKAVSITENKNLSKKIVEELLCHAEDFLVSRVNTEFTTLVCDASFDEVLIEYDDGTILFGQLNELTYQSDTIVEFYEYLSKKTQIENLLFFEDLP